ncbi:MAG: OsmC family protein [Cyclobacteriaceae bacterium]
MIKIELERVDGEFAMEATSETGNKIVFDSSPTEGGHNRGFRPMQSLIAAMGGCSAIDVISILRKQRENLKDIKITVTGEREKDVTPSLYTDIHAHFKLYGDLDKDKAQKAVSLSMEKYCSVAKTLEKTAKVTYSFEIIK